VLAWALAQQGRLRRSGWFNWREATLVTVEEMPMLLRLTLVLGLLVAHVGGCGWPAINVGPAAAEPRFHVDTEDAYATQCQARICATLQVNRSRFSNGAVSTLLFFSAYDERGKRIPIPGFPSGFTRIASEHFVMSPTGGKATLNYSGVLVTWEARDLLKKHVTAREQQLNAVVKGSVGPIVFDPATPRGPGDFSSASLTLRKSP
jgi:hypothetical protein